VRFGKPAAVTGLRTMPIWKVVWLKAYLAFERSRAVCDYLLDGKASSRLCSVSVCYV